MQPQPQSNPDGASLQMVLANPRGFCAGVERAIEIVERALELFPAPVYVRHEIVHNRYVVDSLRDMGAVFVEELSQVPNGATVIFSAHGVSRAVVEEAALRGLRVIDATCPLVTKVHLEVLRHCRAGREVVLIGHAGHPEVLGTMGQAPDGGVLLVSSAEDAQALTVKNPEKLAFVTQTTLSVDDTRHVVAALRQKFPSIVGPAREDICYATTNRQEAVKHLAEQVDLVLVIGAPNSSNSNRLREVAEANGCEAYLIERASDLNPEWFTGNPVVGVTAGASAPEVLVAEVVDRLSGGGAARVRVLPGPEEEVAFSLPPELVS
ncbi:MAG: 4-hydroxy-3-methylbut-2-enyl diphosphate reductase [Nitrospirota bacterium]|nr:4-hydroxy-3-methylbut-2-enyl diphosphate reductase [Nitrospirota bacterium]